ncbi:MAG: rod shape-determining protein MreC, partial [Turneriella sp.]|nr:rod shape-determining protein MreC [Turneriella sp.]
VALQPQESSGQTNLAVGVVGKIIQVNPHSARILPLTDQFSRIGVHLKKTGHWALLIGQSPQQEKPWIDYLSLGVFLSPGDELLTSGGDGIFPRGLPVGRVGKRIERLGSFQRAEVEPAIDFHKLDFVVVIQKKVETETLQFLPLRPENIEEPKLPAAQPGVEKMPPQSVDNKTKETTDTP